MKKLKLKLISLFMRPYVIIEGETQSIMPSKWLYKAMRITGIIDNNNIYVCKVSKWNGKMQREENYYGFCLKNQDLEGVATNFYQLQYNRENKKFGFSPTTPSVAKILYDIDLPYDFYGLVRVRIRHINGNPFFILKPRIVHEA